MKAFNKENMQWNKNKRTDDDVSQSPWTSWSPCTLAGLCWLYIGLIKNILYYFYYLRILVISSWKEAAAADRPSRPSYKVCNSDSTVVME